MKYRSIVMLLAMVMLLISASLCPAGTVFGNHAGAATVIGALEGNSDQHMIEAKDLQQRLTKGEKIIVVDARAAISGAMIKGAVHVPSSQLETWAKDIDKKTIIVTYCTCPHDEAAEGEVQQLRKLGYENAFVLKGGLNAAVVAGMAVENK